MNIWHLSDGKAGHVAQARGLFVALERSAIDVITTDIAINTVSRFALWLHWITGGRLGQLPAALQGLPAPDLIVGVGHATHLALILLQKNFSHSRSVVLMRPTLPIAWFDFAIVPGHDYHEQTPSVLAHVFISKGVLNPLVNEGRHQAARHLILIGGASKRYGWAEDALVGQLQALWAAIGQQPEPQTILLTTSRRTPATFLAQLSKLGLPHNLELFPVTETPPGWLFEQLQQATVVWVTKDSGSMLFEALTAGCRVGLLEMPQIKKDTVTAATDLLAAQRFFLPLDAYLQGESFATVPALDEADRAVAWLLRQLQAM
jgi:mitochondrial fission protein ELM1